jgi:hypothetical protein
MTQGAIHNRIHHEDEVWQSSCKNDFTTLLQRYPLQFAAAPRITLGGVDSFLCSSDPLDAAFVVTGLIPQQSNQIDNIMAQNIVDSSVPKVVIQTRKDGSLHVSLHSCVLLNLL